MDDAFIQSLQITQGREEQRSSLPWVCFSFFMLLFLFHEIFSPNGGSSTAEKSSVGKWLTGGTNFSTWNKSRFGRRQRVPWDKNGIPSDVRSQSDMGEWTSKKCPSCQR